MRARNRTARLAGMALMAASLACGAVVVTSLPAAATSLTSVSWQVGNNASSTANAPATSNTSTYTWTFTTATAIVAGANGLTQITATVPATTTGTPTVATAYGLGTCTTGAVTLASGTVTIPTTCTSQAIAAGTTIQLQLTGFTNPTTPSSSTSVVTLYTTASHTAGDTGTTNSITFSSNSTAINVIVPDSLTFTNNKPSSISLVPLPGAAGIETNPGTMVVATNAHNGYTLAGCSSSLTGPGTAIPLLSTSSPVAAATFLTQATSGWGAEASVTGSATLQNSWSATGYLGYGTNCSLAADNIIKSTGPTAGDTLTVTNGAAISSLQDTGTYSGYVNYLVTPSF